MRELLDGPYIRDSKRIPSEEERIELADELFFLASEKELFLALRSISSSEIDRVGNINQSVNSAWTSCLEEVVAAVTEKDPGAVEEGRITAIIDGNSFRGSAPCPVRNVVKADALFPCVSAASIVAKCVHDDSIDRILRSCADQEERARLLQYGWDRNKGYGTKEHLAAIQEWGVTSHHRLTFHPCIYVHRSSEPRNIDYERKNIGYDSQYPKSEGGGIKCRNFKLCGAVLPKWWWDCKNNYLCINCHCQYGTWGSKKGKGVF